MCKSKQQLNHGYRLPGMANFWFSSERWSGLVLVHTSLRMKTTKGSLMKFPQLEVSPGFPSPSLQPGIAMMHKDLNYRQVHCEHE